MHRRDVDHISAPLFEERTDTRPGAKKRTPQIDIDDAVPLLDGEFFKGFYEIHARVIDQGIDSAILVEGGPDHRVNLVALGYIASHKNRLPAFLAQGGRYGLTLLFTTCDTNDLSALFDENLRDT